MSEYADGIEQCAEAFGFKNIEDMFDEYADTPLVPAWCPNCDATYEMDADETQGYCKECRQREVVSIMVLCDIT